MSHPPRVSIKLTACLFGTLLAVCAPAFAQNISKSNYPGSLPAPKNTYPDYKRPSSLSSPYEAFWEGVKQKESSYTHWRTRGVPLPGWADGDRIISIGISQVRYDTTGKEAASLAGLKWDFDQYLYNASYNEKLGRAYYGKYLKQFNNNPCAAFASYNWGPGAARSWSQGSYSKDGTPFDYSSTKNEKLRSARLYYISKTSALAREAAARYGMLKEVDEILRTSPGCSDKMEDVDTTITGEGVSDRPELHVDGYCSPIAAEMLVAGYKAKQEDFDATYEPMFRQIKSGGAKPAQSGETGGSPASSGGSAPTSPSAGGNTGSGTDSVWEQSMADLSACVDTSWPTMKITYPTMDQIIRGAGQEAVRRACGVARDKMSEQRSRLNGSFYMNTRLPGVPSAGVSTSGSGGESPVGGGP